MDRKKTVALVNTEGEVIEVGGIRILPLRITEDMIANPTATLDISISLQDIVIERRDADR